MMRIDLHMHSTVSDGTDTPLELLERVREAEILKSGGIPVLAHPVFGSGDELILDDRMDQRLKRLLEFGLQGVEAFYSSFTPKLEREMISFAEKYNLYVTAGSDYHGKNKMVALGETNLDKKESIPDALKRFLSVIGHAAGR